MTDRDKTYADALALWHKPYGFFACGDTDGEDWPNGETYTTFYPPEKLCSEKIKPLLLWLAGQGCAVRMSDDHRGIVIYHDPSLTTHAYERDFFLCRFVWSDGKIPYFAAESWEDEQRRLAEEMENRYGEWRDAPREMPA